MLTWTPWTVSNNIFYTFRARCVGFKTKQNKIQKRNKQKKNNQTNQTTIKNKCPSFHSDDIRCKETFLGFDCVQVDITRLSETEDAPVPVSQAVHIPHCCSARMTVGMLGHLPAHLPGHRRNHHQRPDIIAEPWVVGGACNWCSLVVDFSSLRKWRISVCCLNSLPLGHTAFLAFSGHPQTDLEL